MSGKYLITKHLGSDSPFTGRADAKQIYGREHQVEEWVLLSDTGNCWVEGLQTLTSDSTRRIRPDNDSPPCQVFGDRWSRRCRGYTADVSTTPDREKCVPNSTSEELYEILPVGITRCCDQLGLLCARHRSMCRSDTDVKVARYLRVVPSFWVQGPVNGG